MLSFTIEDIKKTMSLLLKGNLFDDFEVRGIEIQTYTRFEINGIQDKEFLDLPEETKKEAPNYIAWRKIKPVVLEIIKGSHSPKSIKIIFSLPDKEVEKYASEASALFINFLFKDKKIMISTGSSMKTFTLNKLYDEAWDSHVLHFFKEQDLAIEQN